MPKDKEINCPIFKACLFQTPCPEYGKCLLLIKKEYIEVLESMEFMKAPCKGCEGKCKKDKNHKPEKEKDNEDS